MQAAGQRKPAIKIRDNQWKGTYSSTTIYYTDDRVYYSGNTYIFTYQWTVADEDEDGKLPSGILPTNTTYWSYIGTGNLGGGKIAELGSEGVFLNGSNITGLGAATGIITNASGAFILQKRNAFSTGISTAVLGYDQTDSSDGASEGHGGWFNRLKVDGIMPSTRVVASSATLTDQDTVVLAGNSSSPMTLTLPSTPVENQMYMIRHVTGNNVLIWANGHYITSTSLANKSSSIIMSEWSAVILNWDAENDIWWASWTVAK
jgi:hypothetical protein